MPSMIVHPGSGIAAISVDTSGSVDALPITTEAVEVSVDGADIYLRLGAGTMVVGDILTTGADLFVRSGESIVLHKGTYTHIGTKAAAGTATVRVVPVSDGRAS